MGAPRVQKICPQNAQTILERGTRQVLQQKLQQLHRRTADHDNRVLLLASGAPDAVFVTHLLLQV